MKVEVAVPVSFMVSVDVKVAVPMGLMVSVDVKVAVPMGLMVSVDIKQHRTMHTHWSQFVQCWSQLVPNMSTDIRGH